MKNVLSKCLVVMMVLFFVVPNHALAVISTASSNVIKVVAYSPKSQIGKTNNWKLRKWLKLEKGPSREAGTKLNLWAGLAAAMALISVPGVFYLYAMITGPLGILFSIFALVSIKKNPRKWHGAPLAIWALVVNLLMLLLALGFYIYLVQYVFD